MFSLGCVQSMKCHTGDCPTGVATQVGWRQKGLVVDDKAERVARFQKETLKALREIVVAMGYDSPWDLTQHDIYQRIDSARAGAIDEVYRFLKPGELLQAPRTDPICPFLAGIECGDVPQGTMICFQWVI
ncbi:glutamate synthase-related protein [Novosphingobium colocasiae]